MARKIKGVVEAKKESKPMTPQDRIDYVFRNFKHYIERYEEARQRFLDSATKYGPSYAIESANEVIRLEFINRELKLIISDYEKSNEQNTTVVNVVGLTLTVRKRLDDVTKQLLNDWLNANSTSYVHNAVQDNRRAGASTLVDILQHAILALTHE